MGDKNLFLSNLNQKCLKFETTILEVKMKYFLFRIFFKQLWQELYNHASTVVYNEQKIMKMLDECEIWMWDVT